MADNLLYNGDNLDILRRYVDDESVDLVYLDPPFKSERSYNVLFAEQDGSRAAAQIKVFEESGGCFRGRDRLLARPTRAHRFDQPTKMVADAVAKRGRPFVGRRRS